MKKVVFVAPLFRAATLRFLRAVAGLPNVRLGVITTVGMQHAPDDLRPLISCHYRVANCLDPGQLAIATRSLAAEMGGVDRLLGILEELQEPLARVREHLKIPGLGVEAATNFRDKSRMKEVMRAAGAPCARSRLVTCTEDAKAFVAEVGYPIVVKPPDGAGARNTFKVDSDAVLSDYLAAFSPDRNRPTLMEEFIQGEEHSFETIAINGKVVWHSLTRYYPSPLEVLRNPWIQWCVLLPRELDHPHWNDIRQAGQVALTALGVQSGLSHMEWFRRKDGSIAISEVGARPPGAQIVTLMSYAHDKDFYKAWAEVVVFDHFQAPERKYAAGAAYLRGQGKGRVKAILGLDQAQKEVGSVVVETKLPVVGQVSASGYEGDGYVIVRHPETEVVKNVLNRLVSLIQVVYEN